MRPASITVHDPHSNHPTSHLHATGRDSVHPELAHLTTTHSSERTGRAPVGATRRGLSVQSQWRCQPPYTSESWCDLNLRFTNPVLATGTPRVKITVTGMCRRCLQSTAGTRLRFHQHGGSNCSHMVTPLSTRLRASLQTYAVPPVRVYRVLPPHTERSMRCQCGCTFRRVR
jgi:hypothetical protein